MALLEKTNVRHVGPGDIDGPVDGATIDVSFISLKLVIPPVSGLLLEHSFIIALIKPQFEVGKGKVGKGGVVRDPDQHHAVLDDFRRFFEDLNWTVQGTIPSPLLGPKGNREFLMHLTR